MNLANQTRKVLICGLGSMGSRRFRCLKALGVSHIAGVDLNPERRERFQEYSGCPVYPSLIEAIEQFQPDCAVISTPPTTHGPLSEIFMQMRVSCFIEAGVDASHHGLWLQYRNEGTHAVPSATLKFHPAVRILYKLEEERELGKLLSYVYHCGQHIEDWHPWEKPADFYVSDPQSGGAREITAFELSWILGFSGSVAAQKGVYRKTSDIAGMEQVADTYQLLLSHHSAALGMIQVDTNCRPAIRRFRAVFSKGTVEWNWDENSVKIWKDGEDLQVRELPVPQAQPGYHVSIGEQMYIDEVDAFLNHLDGLSLFPHSIENDQEALNVLTSVEESDTEANRPVSKNA